MNLPNPTLKLQIERVKSKNLAYDLRYAVQARAAHALITNFERINQDLHPYGAEGFGEMFLSTQELSQLFYVPPQIIKKDSDMKEQDKMNGLAMFSYDELNCFSYILPEDSFVKAFLESAITTEDKIEKLCNDEEYRRRATQYSQELLKASKVSVDHRFTRDNKLTPRHREINRLANALIQFYGDEMNVSFEGLPDHHIAL